MYTYALWGHRILVAVHITFVMFTCYKYLVTGSTRMGPWLFEILWFVVSLEVRQFADETAVLGPFLYVIFW